MNTFLFCKMALKLSIVTLITVLFIIVWTIDYCIFQLKENLK